MSNQSGGGSAWGWGRAGRARLRLVALVTLAACLVSLALVPAPPASVASSWPGRGGSGAETVIEGESLVVEAVNLDDRGRVVRPPLDGGSATAGVDGAGGEGTAAAAAAAPARKLPPHHKVGRSAKPLRPELRGATRSGGRDNSTDPPASPITNQKIVPVLQTAVIDTLYENGGLGTSTVDGLTTLQGQRIGSTNISPQGFVRGAIAADINADGRDELLVGNGTPAPCLFLSAFSLSATFGVAGEWGNPCETAVSTNAYSQQVLLSAGNYFYGAAQGQGQQVMMAWNQTPSGQSQDYICVRAYDNVTGTLQLTQKGIDCTSGPVMTIAPSTKGSSLFPIPATFAVASGDLNGDNQDEFVVAYIEPGGRVLHVNAYGVSESGQPYSVGGYTFNAGDYIPGGDSSWTFFNVSIAIGYFGNDQYESIALGVQTAKGVVLYFLGAQTNPPLPPASGGQLGGTITGFTHKVGGDYANVLFNDNLDFANRNEYGGYVATVAAPFVSSPSPTTLNTTEQVAVVYQVLGGKGDLTTVNTVALASLTGSMNGMVIYVKNWATSGGYPTGFPQFLSAGAVMDWVNGIVLPQLSIGTNCYPGCPNPVMNIAFTQSGGRVTPQTVWTSAPSGSVVPNIGNVLAVVAGDFSGQSVSGVLASQQVVQGAVQLQSVLQAPPTHFDVFPDVTATNPITVNVNVPTFDDAQSCNNEYELQACPQVTYLDQQNQGTNHTTQHTRSWSVSACVGDGLGQPVGTSGTGGQSGGSCDPGGYVSASLSTTYGQNFSKTTEKFVQTTTANGASAVLDDFLLYSATNYNVWEYQLNQNGQTGAYLLVLFPEEINCTTTDCEPASTPTYGSGLSTWWYEPAIQVGNALSYPQQISSTQIQTQVAALNAINTGGDPVPGSLSLQSGNTTSRSTTTNFSVSATISAGISGPVGGISASTTGNYATSSGSVQSMSFNNTTQISWALQGLAVGPTAPNFGGNFGQPGQYAYVAQPYLYFDPQGIQRFAWGVNLQNQGSNSKWAEPYTYGTLPDFTFNLPYYFSGNPPQYTRDIQLSTLTPLPNQPITITATVRNFSLVSYPPPGGSNPPLQVAFWYKNPVTNAKTLIGTQNVPAILNQSSVTVQQPWTTPATAGCAQIEVVLDPGNQIQEVHKANNTGLNAFAIFPNQGAPYQDCSAIEPLVPKGQSALMRVPGSTADIGLAASNVQATLLREAPAAPGARSSGPARAGGIPGIVARPPTAGHRVRLTATVRATGAHFSKVGVTFYDGDPARGGKYIGHRVLLLVPADRDVKTSLDWDTGTLTGKRDIYVKVETFPAQVGRRDNKLARVSINLPPLPPTPTPTAAPPTPTRTPTPPPLPTRNPLDVGSNPTNRGQLPPPTATPTATPVTPTTTTVPAPAPPRAATATPTPRR